MQPLFPQRAAGGTRPRTPGSAQRGPVPSPARTRQGPARGAAAPAAALARARQAGGGSREGGAALRPARTPGRREPSARPGGRGCTPGPAAPQPPGTRSRFRRHGRGRCGSCPAAPRPSPPRGLPVRAGTAARPQLPSNARGQRSRTARRLLPAPSAAGPRSRSRRPSGVNSPGETPRPAPAAAEPGPPLRPPAGRAAAPVAPSRSGSSSSGAAAAPAGPNPLWPPGPRRHVPGPALWKPLCPGPAPGLGSARTPDTPRPAAPGPDVLRPERLRPGQLVPPAGRALGPGGAEGDAGLRPGPTAMAAARLGPRLAGNTCKAHLHGEHSSKIFALPKRWKTISQRQPQPQQLLLGVPHRGMAPARHTRLILCLLITFVQPGSELEPPKCSRPMPVKPIAVNVQRK